MKHNTETGSQPEIRREGSTLTFRFIGSGDDADQQYELIEYLNDFGWKTLGISAAEMEKATEADLKNGIVLESVDPDKAEKLLSIIRKKFPTFKNNFEFTVQSSAVVEAANMPEEIRKDWFAPFEKSIQGRDMWDIANHLCQLGVNVVGQCDCEGMTSPNIVWVHNHHLEHNTAIWKILKKNNLLEAMRKEFQYTLDHPDDTDRQIGEKKYTIALLENFLTAAPNPAWVRA